MGVQNILLHGDTNPLSGTAYYNVTLFLCVSICVLYIVLIAKST